MTKADEPWHVVEGKRGQQFLDRGDTRKANEIFEAILARLGHAPSYGRAVILERLGRSLHLDGNAELALVEFREALTVLGKLSPNDGVKTLRGTLRSELGDAFRALGRHDDAQTAYEAALKIAEETGDRRAQAIEQGRLGILALGLGRIEEAIGRHRTALTLSQQLGEPAAEALAWHQLARVFEQSGEWDEAERHYREAARIDRQSGNAAQLGRHVSALGEMLLRQPQRLAEARDLIDESLRIALSVDPSGADVWRNFGALADAVAQEANLTEDGDRKAALLAKARDYRHLHEYAPRLLVTLAGLSDEAVEAKAVVFERLGRCFQMAGRPDVAMASLAEGLKDADRLAPNGRVRRLRAALHAALGDVCRALNRHDEARTHDEAAASFRLDQSLSTSATTDRVTRPNLALTLSDEAMTDYVFDADLLVEGRRERQTTPWTAETVSLPDDARPIVTPGTRMWTDDREAIGFLLPSSEPAVTIEAGCTVMERTRREVNIAAHARIVWQLTHRMDGVSTTADLLSDLPLDDRAVAARMLAALAATGVVDVSGRAIGRFLHRATKKGVLPAGGLAADEVLELATDGGYREYPDAARLTLSESVPQSLRAFHALTRERRSSRNYAGRALTRGDLEALLFSACGVTGTMPWKERTGREVKLRAYPSSGALYAVEIYPVALRVEGLEEAVYHYRAVENQLERVTRVVPARFVETALPVERRMVAGAAAMVCLTGVFPRHERKYGEGGYRMLVAEAGHISQNLVLAATAMGLSARPFGGVFDDLVNGALGINVLEEQFLLAVLVGHGSGRD